MFGDNKSDKTSEAVGCNLLVSLTKLGSSFLVCTTTMLHETTEFLCYQAAELVARMLFFS